MKGRVAVVIRASKGLTQVAVSRQHTRRSYRAAMQFDFFFQAVQFVWREFLGSREVFFLERGAFLGALCTSSRFKPYWSQKYRIILTFLKRFKFCCTYSVGNTHSSTTVPQLPPINFETGEDQRDTGRSARKFPKWSFISLSPHDGIQDVCESVPPELLVLDDNFISISYQKRDSLIKVKSET